MVHAPGGRAFLLPQRLRSAFLSLALGSLVFLYLWRNTRIEPHLESPGGPTPASQAQYTTSDLLVEEEALPVLHATCEAPANGTSLWAQRAEEVRQSFLEAYRAYEVFAWGGDQLRPSSNTSHNIHGTGWGLTIIDALDTMHALGFCDDVARATEYIKTVSFSATPDNIEYPSIVDSYLGGLLSAYYLTRDQGVLSKAGELAEILLTAFNTTSGLPGMWAVTTLKTTRRSNPLGSTLAEIAAGQLEFTYAAQLKGNAQYLRKLDRVVDLLQQQQGQNGLLPSMWFTENGTASGYFGVAKDSLVAYDNLLKRYLLTGRTEIRFLRMYRDAARGILDNLLFLSPTRGLLYASYVENSIPTGWFSQHSCGLAGLLALGAHTLSASELPEDERARHRSAARGLAQTCFVLSVEQRHGLSPEYVRFERPQHSFAFNATEDQPGGEELPAPLERSVLGNGIDYYTLAADPVYGAYNVDRHELWADAIESIYILWATTGDVTWREKGWKMWENLQENARVENGYAVVTRLHEAVPRHEDSLPSHFFAKTLKYHYLLFSEREPWPLTQFVHTSGGHLLPIFKWTAQERKTLDIRP